LISFNSSRTLVNCLEPSIAASNPLVTLNAPVSIPLKVFNLLAALAVTAAVEAPPVNGAIVAAASSSSTISPIL